jgi:hypothetical protein
MQSQHKGVYVPPTLSMPLQCWNFLDIHSNHELYFFDTIKKAKGTANMTSPWKSSQLLSGRFGSREMIKSLETPIPLFNPGGLTSSQSSKTCVD